MRSLACGEESASELALKPHRADRVWLGCIDQDEVMEHYVLSEVDGVTVVSTRFAAVSGDVAVRAGRQRVRVDRIVEFATHGTVYGP